MYKYLILLIIFCFMRQAHAQAYPLRSARIVIPFAPGGAIDVVFRLLSPGLSAQLGQSVVVSISGQTAIIFTTVVKAMNIRVD